MTEHSFVRRLALGLAALVCCLVFCLPAAAADTAPYAEDGDLDYIRNYVVTVDLREDGSADITYDIDWQVIGGSKTDYLSWVKIGLANAHVDELTPLTDTIAEIEYRNDGGSYAQVVFTRRYYAPAIAAENGGQSEVSFAFRVHQSHLFTRNDDGTANFVFTPGWFDDLSVGNLQIRWRNGEGFTADNTGVDGDYLVWDFGPLAHGQAATARVTVPVTEASAYAPDAAMTEEDYAPGGSDLDKLLANVIFVVVLLFILVIVLILAGSRAPRWGGGLGGNPAAAQPFLQPLDPVQIDDIALPDRQHLRRPDLLPDLRQRFPFRIRPPVPADINAVLAVLVNITDFPVSNLLNPAVFAENPKLRRLIRLFPDNLIQHLLQFLLHLAL